MLNYGHFLGILTHNGHPIETGGFTANGDLVLSFRKPRTGSSSSNHLEMSDLRETACLDYVLTLLC
jgi:hypothetical protein